MGDRDIVAESARMQNAIFYWRNPVSIVGMVLATLSMIVTKYGAHNGYAARCSNALIGAGFVMFMGGMVFASWKWHKLMRKVIDSDTPGKLNCLLIALGVASILHDDIRQALRMELARSSEEGYGPLTPATQDALVEALELAAIHPGETKRSMASGHPLSPWWASEEEGYVSALQCLHVLALSGDSRHYSNAARVVPKFKAAHSRYAEFNRELDLWATRLAADRAASSLVRPSEAAPAELLRASKEDREKPEELLRP